MISHEVTGAGCPATYLPNPRIMGAVTTQLVNFASILEDSTREQAERASRMPFIHPHVALMPDAHLGKGATVGS